MASLSSQQTGAKTTWCGCKWWVLRKPSVRQSASRCVAGTDRWDHYLHSKRGKTKSGVGANSGYIESPVSDRVPDNVSQEPTEGIAIFTANGCKNEAEYVLLRKPRIWHGARQRKQEDFDGAVFPSAGISGKWQLS